MKTIEQITGETCVNQIRAMKEAYVPEEDLKCRFCNGNEYCENYRPVKIFEIPINDVRFNNEI